VGAQTQPAPGAPLSLRRQDGRQKNDLPIGCLQGVFCYQFVAVAMRGRKLDNKVMSEEKVAINTPDDDKPQGGLVNFPEVEYDW